MIIYEPRGGAQEYAPLAVNLYRGCSCGCAYCYAPRVLRINREAFHRAPEPKRDALVRLERDAKRLAGDPRRVLLSFTHDPYDPADADRQLTRQAIEILHRNELGVEILTKNGTSALRDLDLLTPRDRMAASLTFDNDADSLEWEPGAALPGDRIRAIRTAHASGVPTWISCEPVVSAEQTLQLIGRVSPYADEIRVGTLNHHPRAKATDWPEFGARARALLERLGSRYVFKADLLRQMGAADHGTAAAD